MSYSLQPTRLKLKTQSNGPDMLAPLAAWTRLLLLKPGSSTKTDDEKLLKKAIRCTRRAIMVALRDK